MAVAVLDAQGLVVFWSTAAEQLLGYPAREIVGRSCLDLFARPQEAGTRRGVVRRLRDSGHWGGELVLRHRDGHAITLGGRVFPLLAGADEGSGWFAVAAGEQRWTAAVSEAMGGEFLAHAPVGMAVLDEQLRYVWVNDAMVRGGGVPLERLLGQRWGDPQPGLDTDAARAQLQRVLDEGAPVVDFTYRGRARSDPGRERVFSMSAFRLERAPNGGKAVAFMVLDATVRWQARERLAVLNEAGARIGSTLDVLRTAQELAGVAVPRLADFVTVDLLDQVLSGEEPTSAGVLMRAAQQSVRPGCPEAVVAIGDPAAYGPSSPVARCLADGQAVLAAEPDAINAWTSSDPARHARIGDFGLRSGIVVPVRARGVTLGVATFIRWQSEVPFEEDDLLLAQEFVARAAVCLDNARRYTHEHATALTLQRSLLPHRLPCETTVEVATRYLPADVRHGVGGDWVDVIPLSGARTALVAGDVAGHGIHAAATMGRLRAAVHTLAALDLPPDELLAHLDDLVNRLREEGPPGSDGPGATCLYLEYDPVSGRCTMARAGHPPPVLARPDGTVGLADLPAGPPLGLGGLPFECATFDLPDQTLIALYTDGLLETCDRDIDIGLSRLTHALAHPQRQLEQMCDDAIDALLTAPQSDDVALLLARPHPLPAHRLATWELSSDPALVAWARDQATSQLQAWGLPEMQPTTALIVSELVTNAIRYGSSPMRLRLIYHNALICEVSDANSTAPHLRHANTTDEGGRGLFLIAQLAYRWGTRHTAAGKTIWAEQTLPPSAC